ncbi:hypothetical protein QYF36_001947 [Acer negundo]|nr:hypothetical protein QYF36_001947 [Acer negundo]
MENNTKKVTCDSKAILKTEELYQYLLETSVYPREPEPLKEIRDATASHAKFMGTAPDAGQLMAMLLKIIAIDVNRESYEIGLPVIKRDGEFEQKIDFIEPEGLPVLDQLLMHKENEGSFDYAYVDADKGWNAMPEEQTPEFRKSIQEFNKLLAADPRIQISQVPLGNGITVCRRIY